MNNFLIKSDDNNMLKSISKDAYASNLIKTVKNVQQAYVVVSMGYEMGIPPMTALAHIFIVNDKPCCDAILMLALIKQKCPDSIIDYVLRTKEKCLIEVRRKPSDKVMQFEFSIEDAKTAQLTHKDNWKKYPKNMLTWRTISDMAKLIFPDCVLTLCYTPDELGAETDTHGRLKDVGPELKKIEEELAGKTVEEPKEHPAEYPAEPTKEDIKAAEEKIKKEQEERRKKNKKKTKKNGKKPKEEPPKEETPDEIDVTPETIVEGEEVGEIVDTPLDDLPNEAPQIEPTPEEIKKKRNELGKKINEKRQVAEIKPSELGDQIKKQFAKDPKQLTIEELERTVAWLDNKIEGNIV